MQEEVTRGAVTLIVDGAKLSEQVFDRDFGKYDRSPYGWKCNFYIGRTRFAIGKWSTYKSRHCNKQ